MATVRSFVEGRRLHDEFDVRRIDEVDTEIS